MEETEAGFERLFATWPTPSKRQPSIPEPEPQAARPPPRELSTEELLRELRQLHDTNLKLARSKDLDPCATGQWASVYRAARDLGHRDDVPVDAWPFIHDIIAAHHRWESRHRPRHDPETQSIRIRY